MNYIENIYSVPEFANSFVGIAKNFSELFVGQKRTF